MRVNEIILKEDSSKVFQSMGKQLIQIGKDADKIKKHDPETLKQGIVKKLEQIDDPKLTHATRKLIEKVVHFNRNNPKTMAAIFGFTFAIIARVSMQVSHHYGLSPTQATLVIEATLPTLGNFLGYLVNGFSVKDSVQAGLIAGTIGVGGTLAASGALTELTLDDEDLGEAINPETLKTRFKHQVEIGDYLYKADVHYMEYNRGIALRIRCFDGNKVIGKVLFKMYDDHLESEDTEVNPNYKKQGIATNMYAYAKMLGNDIFPSFVRTKQGKEMWNSWIRSKQAQHITPPGYRPKIAR